MPNVRGVHKGYSEVLEFQIIIWKGLTTPRSRLKHASRILSRLGFGLRSAAYIIKKI
jgi:hypothetical protein